MYETHLKIRQIQFWLNKCAQKAPLLDAHTISINYFIYFLFTSIISFPILFLIFVKIFIKLYSFKNYYHIIFIIKLT